MLLCILHKAVSVNSVHPFLTICFPERSFFFNTLDKRDQYLFCHVFNPISNALRLFSFSMKYKMYLPISRREIKSLQIEGSKSTQEKVKVKTNSGLEFAEYYILTWNFILKTVFDFLFLSLY